jgi:hypothetical protein
MIAHGNTVYPPVIISPSSPVVKKVPHQLWMYHYYLLFRRVLTFLLPTAAALRYPPSNHSSPVDFFEGARFEFPVSLRRHYSSSLSAHIIRSENTSIWSCMRPSVVLLLLPPYCYYGCAVCAFPVPILHSGVLPILSSSPSTQHSVARIPSPVGTRC